MNMEAVCSTETLIHVYQFAWRYNIVAAVRTEYITFLTSVRAVIYVEYSVAKLKIFPAGGAKVPAHSPHKFSTLLNKYLFSHHVTNFRRFSSLFLLHSTSYYLYQVFLFFV
jgi:hypothetical protein